MHEIIAGQLWAGHIGDARDVRSVLSLGVQAMVDLASNELPVTVPRDIAYLRFPIVDGTGNEPDMLRLAVQTTVTLIDTQVSTFVFCSAGLSRTPAIVAAALGIVENRDPDESLKGLSDLMPHDVLPGLWSEVKTACYLSEN